MIHFVVAETNSNIRENITNTIESTMLKNGNLPFQLSFVQSKKEILPFIENDDRKVFILDLHLKDSTALEIAQIIREQNSDWESIILILSAWNDLSIRLVMNLLVFDYISLCQENTFHLLEEDIIRIIKWEEERYGLSVMSQNQLHRIRFRDILYITRDSFSRKSCIVTKTHTIFTFLPLYEIKNKLPPSFLQVQRSYIVNINEISSVDFKENTIYFKGREDKIWFSRRYSKIVREKLLQDCQKV